MTAVATRVAPIRRGPQEWVRSWTLLVRWEVTSMRLVLPMLVMIQFLVGAGSVLAIALWFDQVPPGVGLFVTTGGATICLMQVALVMGPQFVATQRQQGTYDFLWSLPTPRTASVAAWVTLNLLVSVPAVFATFAVGSAVYDLNLSITLSIVPAILVTVVTATMVGYAMAHGVPSPMLVAIASQVLIFVMFGFTPILFPERNLPAWLSSLHDWLPMQPMANVVRASVTDGIVTDLARSYVVVGVWGLVCTVLGVWIVRRRA